MTTNLRGLLCLAIVTVAVTGVACATSVVLPPDFQHTRLHQAAEKDDPEALQTELKALTDEARPIEVNRLDRDGYTPLACAARQGSLACARLLLEAGALPDLAESHSKWTPLMRAAEQGHAEVVRLLAEKGADVNNRTPLGRTPLRVALTGTHFRQGPEGDWKTTVKILLDHRADIAPLLEHIERLKVQIREQHGQTDSLAEENQRLHEQVRQLNETLAKIRSAAGHPGVNPSNSQP